MTLGVGALVVMALATTAPDQLLDPDDTGPAGGKAIVEVLRKHGVDVEVVRSIGALADAQPGSGSTVVMANSAYVGHDSATTMGHVSAGADRLVLLDPTAAQLAALDLPLTSGALEAQLSLTAGCTSAVARADDTALLVDTRFIPVKRGSGRPATLCFALPDPRGGDRATGDQTKGDQAEDDRAKDDRARDDAATDDAATAAGFGFGAAMATVPAAADHPEVVALGISAAFTNRWVDDESHAGLAIRALGHSPRLVWYQPGLGDLASFTGEPTDGGWPVWLAPASAVLATAVVLLALVRGRRMGALVTEPLPVVVRAVETTESRGRIYRRARDRSRAAAILRQGTIERLARRLALPPHAAQPVQAAAAAATGMPPAQVATLLAGPPPTTDVDLHHLANALTDLEERVRRS